MKNYHIYGLPTQSRLPTISQDTRGNEASQLYSVSICQENGTCDDRPTALVTHNNCTSALDSGITGQKKKSILAVRFCHYSPHQVAIYN